MGGYITKVCNPEQYNEKTDDGPSYLYEYDSAGRLVQLTGQEGKSSASIPMMRKDSCLLSSDLTEKCRRAMLTMWTEI